MDEHTALYYQSNAQERADLYESVESPLGPLLPLLFQPGQTVLDVGAGSGRDCATLLSLKIDAYGIEPVLELHQEAITRHPELINRVVHTTLEDYAPTHRGRYDGVLLSAVLMHVPDSQLFNFVLAIRELLKPEGTLVVSVPLERDDVDPTTHRDAAGRLFVLRSESELTLFFERLGFVVESRCQSNDSLGRDTLWVTSVFTIGTGVRG